MSAVNETKITKSKLTEAVKSFNSPTSTR